MANKKAVKKTKVAKGISLPRGKAEKLSEKKGGSSTGRYKGVAPKEFAGKAGGTSPFSFPINTLKRARNALARSHFAPDPEGIRKKVYSMYPELKKRKMEKESRGNEKSVKKAVKKSTKKK